MGLRNGVNKYRYSNVFLICLVFYSCDSITKDHNYNIKGFWKYTLSNPMTGRTDSSYQFMEIKDTTFVFWHEHIEYLPPLRYWLQNDSIFVESLSTAVLNGNFKSNKEFFGILKKIRRDSFFISSDEINSKFSLSNKAVFKKVARSEWIEDNF